MFGDLIFVLLIMLVAHRLPVQNRLAAAVYFADFRLVSRIVDRVDMCVRAGIRLGQAILLVRTQLVQHVCQPVLFISLRGRKIFDKTKIVSMRCLG